MAQAAAAAAAAACGQSPRIAAASSPPTPPSASTSGARASVCFAPPLRKVGWRAGLGRRHRLTLERKRGNGRQGRLMPLECSQVADFSDSTCGSQLDGIVDALLVNSSIAPVMKSKYGAFGGATLEKAKLDISQSTAKSQPMTEDGGGGGDIGKNNHHGGGDGGDDGGDDDDYFGEADDGDEGDDGGIFGRRVAVPELFDRKVVEAVLQEWYRTASDMPAGIGQAVEMGLISSAQMVRFLAITSRPTMARTVSRITPSSISRAFIGRLIADPSFMAKLVLEQAATIGYGVWWEIQHRGERIREEWDLAAANVLTMAVCNMAICWTLAPSRSYGNTFKYEFQNAIQKLPNNVFDKSYPLREFDTRKRVFSFFYKAAELSLVGMVSGTVGAGLSRVKDAISKRTEKPSVPVPSASTSALAYGAFLGLSGNLRYQLVYGAERAMQQSFNSVGVVIAFSSLLRLLNIYVGDSSRVSWLCMDVAPAAQLEGQQKAYRRPSLAAKSFGGWVIPNAGFISDFFGDKKEQNKELKESTATSQLSSGPALSSQESTGQPSSGPASPVQASSGQPAPGQPLRPPQPARRKVKRRVTTR